jgi:hypothetical protein
LAGIKEGKSWVVLLPATPGADPAALSADPAGFADPDTTPTYGPPAALEVAAVEALERLLRDERRISDQNRDAALHWQFRAQRAEERLKELEAGPLPTNASEPTIVDVPQESAAGPVRDVQPAQAAEPMRPPADGLALGWRRWWRRVTGG